MRCSIIVVNWETSDLLKQLLISLERFGASGGMETIVVDNASADFDADRFRSEFPNVEFLPQPTNCGYSAGNNLAASRAKGDYLVLLNPDTEATEGALDTLLSFLEGRPSAAIAAPKLVYPDGRLQRSCRGFPWPGSLIFYASGLSRILPKSRLVSAYPMGWFDHNSTQQVDQPMASCWAVPARVWQAVGEFDTQFPLFFNDVDWAFRARQEGYEIWFVSEATVVHHHGQSTKKAGARAAKASHEGLVRFYKKWMNGRSPRPAIWLAQMLSLAFYRARGLRQAGRS